MEPVSAGFSPAFPEQSSDIAMPARGPLFLCLLLLGCYWLCHPTPSCQAITIDVRLYCEVSGGCRPGDFFVDNPQALATLQFAVKAFEPFTDSLLPVPASPSWNAVFTNPDDGSSAMLHNLSVPAGTLILYAGGYDMPDNQVGQGGPGQANISLSRGQGAVSGPAAVDFASWGGAIAFDTLDNGAPRKWHFGISSLPGPGQVDFLTIAFHELAHVFGFGTADAFDNLIFANQLQGAAVIGLTGAAAPLTSDNNHWVSGTTSPPYADEPLSPLSASLLLGRRVLLTPLDYAALKDLGWQVPDKLLGLHGDADQDGDVDGRDFLLWQRGFGATGVGVPGDIDGNQKVDQFDLWLWQNNNGAQASVGLTAANMQVPEPTTFVLACLTAVATSYLIARRRASATLASP